MKQIMIRFFLVPYLVVGLISCGGGSGGSSSSIEGTQNNLTKEMVSDIGDILDAVEEFNDSYGNLATYDEEAGNAWLDLFNNRIIPLLDSAYENTQTLIEGEEEIEAMINAAQSSTNTSSVNSSKGFFIPLLLVGVFFTAVGASLLNTGLKVKARVQAVEAKIEQARAAGASQAEAMGQASSTFQSGFNETRLDIYNFILTNKLADIYSSVSSTCGKVLIDLTSAAGDVIELGKTRLMGVKRKDDSSKVTSDDLSEIIYIGETSDDGIAENFPLGTWDLVAFRDGYVRNAAEGMSISSCSTTERVTIPMVTMAELEGASGEEEDGGDTGGSFEVISYVNTDGSRGSSASGAQISVSGNASYPTIRWTFSGAIAITVTTGSGDGLYGIMAAEDESGDQTPFSSPVTYGDYGKDGTIPLPSYDNPSPALTSGTTYGITLNTESGKYATLAFEIN